MEKILISACLAKDMVRYDGSCASLESKCLDLLDNKGMLYRYCPEVEGGMKVPRAPSQIAGGTGSDVLAGRARVMDIKGNDVTRFFIEGAELALSIVRTQKIRVALLKEKSPSCGPRLIYDGSFSSTLIKGAGVTAAVLTENNVLVFSENEIHEFKTFIKQNFSNVYL